jgi:hypothetical protein
MTFENLAFKIESPEQSERFQKVVFELGYKWASGFAGWWHDQNIKYLFLNDRGYITWSDNRDFKGAEKYTLENTEQFILDNNDENKSAIITGKVKSDGGSSSYYKLTITNDSGETLECETYNIIYALVGGDFFLGNIIKAARRIFEVTQGRGKDGTDLKYDVTKIKFFADKILVVHDKMKEDKNV